MSEASTVDATLPTAPSTAPHFLIHNEGDHVGVAVQEIEPGPAKALYMDTDREVDLQAVESVPLGHKIALVDLEEAADVIEYGVRIGVARKPISRGTLVHVHNLRSARWQQSQT